MSSEPELPDDKAFERRLLESAKADAEPRQVRAAWGRFERRLGTFLAEHSVDPGGPRARVPAPATAIPTVATGVTSATAVKWLLLGAIGGSGLTAGVMMERRHPKLDRPPTERGSEFSVAAVDQPPPQAQTPQAQSRGAGPTVPLPEQSGATTKLTADHGQARHISRAVSDHRGRSHGTAPASRDASKKEDRHPTPVVPSRLAAEVSRIDNARAAISIGDYDEAIQLIERYHDDFPDGALAPDADVVALQAVAAKRDRSEIARRARSFLSRYPNDPHAARVRVLVGDPPER